MHGFTFQPPGCELLEHHAAVSVRVLSLSLGLFGLLDHVSLSGSACPGSLLDRVSFFKIHFGFGFPHFC